MLNLMRVRIRIRINSVKYIYSTAFFNILFIRMVKSIAKLNNSCLVQIFFQNNEIYLSIFQLLELNINILIFDIEVLLIYLINEGTFNNSYHFILLIVLLCVLLNYYNFHREWLQYFIYDQFAFLSFSTQNIAKYFRMDDVINFLSNLIKTIYLYLLILDFQCFHPLCLQRWIRYYVQLLRRLSCQNIWTCISAIQFHKAII